MQRRTLRVGAFVFQTVYSQWERGGGEQARAPRVGEGNGQPLSSYQSEGKGAWGRYDPPPIPFVPWGYRSLEPGEKGSFWRPEGGVI